MSHKFSNFIYTRSFYIALVLCVAAVVTSAVLVSTYNKNNGWVVSDNEGSKTTDDFWSRWDSTYTPGMNATPTPAATATPGADTALQDDDQTLTAGTIPDEIGDYVKPVSGAVVLAYSMDKLVYSKTLEDWRVHAGLDLAGEEGSDVKAACGGVVLDVRNDPRYGFTVVLEHDDGIQTVYSNLASADTVYPNQLVKQGDVIGTIGRTSQFEAVSPSHLHFEVLYNNKYVDPTLVFK